MLTKKQNDAMRLYAAIMEEVKIRVAWIDLAYSGKTGLHPHAVREFCFLQLRMLCELIALGCLAAHGDITAAQTSKLRKEYAADRIVAALEALHPTFYPKPVKQVLVRPHFFNMENVTSGYLTKEELMILYTRAGAVLHRGSIKKLLKPVMPHQTDFQDILNWTVKLQMLLNQHLVALFDGKIIFVQHENYRR